VWQLYLLLREIVDIVFAETCTTANSIYLKCKIEDHNSQFKKVFPDKNLLPKHHILLHYAEVLRKVGPLVRSSTIHFEAMHFESKQFSSIVCVSKIFARPWLSDIR
jgi:hypothetical protein